MIWEADSLPCITYRTSTADALKRHILRESVKKREKADRSLFSPLCVPFCLSSSWNPCLLLPFKDKGSLLGSLRAQHLKHIYTVCDSFNFFFSNCICAATMWAEAVFVCTKSPEHAMVVEWTQEVISIVLTEDVLSVCCQCRSKNEGLLQHRVHFLC